MYSAAGLEDEFVDKTTALANSLALYMQKVDIIRDYHEDLSDEREYWSKQVSVADIR